MNKPETLELFDQPDEEKVQEQKVQKMPNTSVFLINKEDHTFGNVLYQQLLREKHIEFVGYKMPHPLEHRLEVKIQTTDHTTPVVVLKNSIQALQDKLDILKKRLLQQTQGSEWEQG